MKCQILFSRKNIISLMSAEFAYSMVRRTEIQIYRLLTLGYLNVCEAQSPGLLGDTKIA